MQDIWQDKTVYIKGFWGWRPETWAAIGFTGNRRETLVSDTTDPFIMVIYVTQNASDAEQDIRGKIVGFYVVSHQKGHRNEFTDRRHHALAPDKWQNALQAIRAFSFLPEYRPDVYSFDPSLKEGAQGKAYRGVELTPDKIEILKAIPYVEVPIYDPAYGSSKIYNDQIHIPKQNKVRGGPVNRSGYSVDGEPLDTEKELYALVLEGGAEAFLNETMSGYKVYKIGLSISPKIRLTAFQKSLPHSIPEGKVKWQLHRSTRKDGHLPYPNFDSALSGEDAIKDYLAQNGHWLGGEFYAVSEDQFERAWTIGRAAALKKAEELGESA